MAVALKYVGVQDRADSLIVFVDVVVGGVKYAQEVKIPYRDLTHKEIAYGVNVAVAKRLRAEWETVPPPWMLDDSLPGIG